MRLRKGFTWQELIILVLITGVLTGITIPKFKDLIVRSKEANTKAGLASLRSAIQVYYAENHAYPQDTLECLIKDGKYLPELPITQIPGTKHTDTNNVLANSDITDEGGWVYHNDKTKPSKWGKIFINCSHKDHLETVSWNEL